MPMADSILNSVKQLLEIDEEDKAFDKELIIHINSVIATLTQLGVGPTAGYMITSEANTWNELLGTRTDLADVVSYTYMRVRLLFDPPQNSFLVQSINNQCKECEWRIVVRT